MILNKYYLWFKIFPFLVMLCPSAQSFCGINVKLAWYGTLCLTMVPNDGAVEVIALIWVFILLTFNHFLSQKFHGIELVVKKLGYQTVIALLADLPEIVVIERPSNGDWLVFDKRTYRKELIHKGKIVAHHWKSYL